MTQSVCPEHGIPDCSPLMNGCSRLTDEWRNDMVMTKHEFLGGLNRYRDQAYWLWDALDSEEWINEEVSEAYAQQATTASSVRWKQLIDRLFDKLQREDPTLAAAIPFETFSQFVPWIAGGWLMQQKVGSDG